MAPLVLRKLVRRFGSAADAAVDRFDLEVKPGEFVVLVGPSGCGKSTVLRLVAGLDLPDEGEVLIDGQPMNRVSPKDRDVAMVFQGYALYPHMSARDIIGFPLKMRGVAKAERHKAVEHVADMLSIRPLLGRRPSELSGGERQRVAMGRALVRRPKVFLFDEPLSNLDAALRAEIRVEIGTLVRKLGVTTVYVTHDHVEAMTLGDRIAIMRKGRLEQVGTPRAVYEAPATGFVASFLGSPAMALNPLKQGDGFLTLGSIRLTPANMPGTSLVAGIRPEHITLATTASGHAHGTASVVAVEPLGPETVVHLDTEGALLRARIPGLSAPMRGENVSVSFDPRNLHTFEATEKQNRVSLDWGTP